MDQILGLIGGFFILIIIQVAYRLIFGTLSAASKAITGQGTFSDNLNASIVGMKPMEMRIIDKPLNNEEGAPIIKCVEVKGLFPITYATEAAFVTSVIDRTTDEKMPVLSYMEQYQEAKTYAYQHCTKIGTAQPQYGYIKWIQVGVVIPEILRPAHSGKRKLLIILRFVDLNNPPEIDKGLHNGKPPGMLWIAGVEYEQTFSDKGYVEATEHREESQLLSIKIALAVAMNDGALADSKGEIIKGWISKSIAHLPEAQKSRMKELYNVTFAETYVSAVKGELILSGLVSRLNQIGEKNVKYDTYELCFEIVASDKKGEAKENRIIKQVADALNLVPGEIERIKDQKIINLDVSATSNISVDELLGIQEGWNDEQKKKHLRDQFQKWNGRLNTLPEGTERENAQKMLELIAEARKKSA